jgi:phage-related protein
MGRIRCRSGVSRESDFPDTAAFRCLENYWLIAKYIETDIIVFAKPIKFLGDSLARLREFPAGAKREAGFQLNRGGLRPNDFKPMRSIGMGVEEIRVWDDTGTYRVIYTARFADAVFVLHVFQKQTQTTSKQDIDLAKRRFAQLSRQQR